MKKGNHEPASERGRWILESGALALEKISRLPGNPKEHDIGAISMSLDRFGFLERMIINRQTGRLISGHGRLDTLMHLKASGAPLPVGIDESDGEWLVPVDYVDLPEHEEMAAAVALNRTTELGGWNDAALAAVLSDLAVKDALTGVGYDRDDVDELLRCIDSENRAITQDDDRALVERAEELRSKWQTAENQIWEAGPHHIWCGDSREVPASFFQGNKIMLVWTDPPYGVAYSHKNEFLNRSDRGNRIQKEIANDQMTPENTERLFVGALLSVVPHCKPGAALYATVPGGPLYVRFIAGLEAAGFGFRAGLVWVKNQFVIGMSDYHYRHEPILYAWLKNGTHYWNGDRSQDSVFEVDKPHISDLHPTTKPVELVARMIANSSHPSDIVYDPFLGSGTVLVAAH